MLFFRGILFVLVVFLFSGVRGQKYLSDGKEALPELELGILGIHFQVPDYPGSDHSRSFTVPFPYGVYRGKYIQADDEEGVRSDLFENGWVKLGVSLRGGLPSYSEDNIIRKDMPDLHWLGEFGPKLTFYLYQRGDFKIHIDTPVRFVFSTNGQHSEEQGFVFSPFLSIRKGGFLKNAQWLFRVNSAWSTKKLMQYFYDIEPRYVTADRQLYNAQPGLLQQSVVVGWNYHYDGKTTYFAGFKKQFFVKATNTQSDLHVVDENISFAVGVTWLMYESQERQQLR
jgi:MipA family protein